MAFASSSLSSTICTRLPPRGIRSDCCPQEVPRRRLKQEASVYSGRTVTLPTTTDIQWCPGQRGALAEQVSVKRTCELSSIRSRHSGTQKGQPPSQGCEALAFGRHRSSRTVRLLTYRRDGGRVNDDTVPAGFDSVHPAG